MRMATRTGAAAGGDQPFPGVRAPGTARDHLFLARTVCGRDCPQRSAARCDADRQPHSGNPLGAYSSRSLLDVGVGRAHDRPRRRRRSDLAGIVPHRSPGHVPPGTGILRAGGRAESAAVDGTRRPRPGRHRAPAGRLAGGRGGAAPPALGGAFPGRAARRWRLRPGGLTLLFTINAALMAILQDYYAFALVGLAAGIAAGLLLPRLPQSPRPREFQLFAFLVPAVYYLIYFVALTRMANISPSWGTLTRVVLPHPLEGIAWNVQLWTGTALGGGLGGVGAKHLIPLEGVAARRPP